MFEKKHEEPGRQEHQIAQAAGKTLGAYLSHEAFISHIPPWAQYSILNLYVFICSLNVVS